jgi:predicted nucleic acid-binding protein
MRRYFDTSLLVAALIREAGTAVAKTYLSACGDEPLFISALTMFRPFSALRLQVVNIESVDFEVAAGMSDHSAVALRAGDALHLAVCRRLGSRLATFDAGLAAAANHHGVSTDFLTVP